MPAVFGKIEGSGNGIKTVIPNISDVGTSLHRGPAEVNKFFGTELGAQTRYSAETDRAIVNGAHTDATLQDLIKRYIDKFVLCPNCSLPETEYKIKNDTIFHKCMACGAKEMVDMSHKLCNFILAENKKAKKDGKGKGKKVGQMKRCQDCFVLFAFSFLTVSCCALQEDKKSKKKDKDGSDEDKKSKKKDKDKKKSKKKDKDGDDTGKSLFDMIRFQRVSHHCANEAMVNNTENGGDKDYLEKAMFGKKEEEDFGGDDDEASLASEAGVDDTGARKAAVEAVRKFLDENPDAPSKELVEVVTNQQMASALKSQEKVYILITAAITPNFFKKKEVAKYSDALIKITNNNKIMERHLISTLEALSMDKPKNFPVLIKQFYDEDALAEETILEWADDGRTEYTLDVVDEESRAALRGEAEPVVVWLQEAESDDESEDED